MEKILKYFATLMAMVEEAILKVFAEMASDPVEDAFLRLEIMKAGPECRRLKLAIGQQVAAPSFEYDNASYLTDDEVKAGFLSANIEARVAFVQAMLTDTSPVAERVKQVLAAIQTETARKKAEEEKRRQTETQRILTDEEALLYIRQAPEGRFHRPEELGRYIQDGKVICMVTKTSVSVEQARVLGFCLIAGEESAVRLSKKSRKGWTPSVSELMKFLETRAKEAEGVKAKVMTDVEAADTLEKLALLVAEVRAYDQTKNVEGMEKPTWQAKLRVDELRQLVFEKRNRLSEAYIQKVHQGFGHQNLSDLEARIERLRADLAAKQKEEGVPEAALNSLQFCLRVCETHREWLARHQAQKDNVLPIRRGDPDDEKHRLAHRYCVSINKVGLKPEEELAEFAKRSKGQGGKKAKERR